MNWRMFILAALLAIHSNCCFSQGTFDDSLRRMEEQRRQMEMDNDRARIRSLEFEADMARIRAQTERIRAETERLTTDREGQTAAEQARREASRQEEAARTSARKAQEAADEMRAEMNLAGVRLRNNFYLLGLVAAIGSFGVFVAKSKRRGVLMGRNEKLGIVTIIVSFLLALFFLMISTNWVHNLDFLNNLMLALKIQLIQDEGYSVLNEKFLIDFPTKYLILGCLVAAAYGVTTYLGITPVPWKEKEKDQQA